MNTGGAHHTERPQGPTEGEHHPNEAPTLDSCHHRDDPRDRNHRMPVTITLSDTDIAIVKSATDRGVALDYILGIIDAASAPQQSRHCPACGHRQTGPVRHYPACGYAGPPYDPERGAAW